VDSLISRNKIEPIIIIGIDNAGNERANEYLPWEDIYLSPPIHKPDGKKYPEFLTTEVMPLIERKYKILKGKENTGIGGSSYGGLIAFYSLIMKPDYFGFALIESPSLYVDNQKKLKLADSSFSKWNGKIYMGIGTNELGIENCDSDNPDNKMAVSDVQNLQTIIRERSPDCTIAVKIDSCAVHDKKAWSKRFPNAMGFLLPKNDSNTFITKTNYMRTFKKLYSTTVMMTLVILLLSMSTFCQQNKIGIRGDSSAIAEMEAMVKNMGGKMIWSQLKNLHFVHRWFYWNSDSYVEDEILDLTGPRSWIEMKSETYHRIRAYSPEHKYWNIINGKFSYANEQAFKDAMERAPYSLYRIARAIATEDSNYEIKYGEEEFPGARRLEIYGPDGERHGYIVLNFKKEPLVWATTQYKYTFGPMKQFGNLFVPNWAVTAEGAVTYEMISLVGDNQLPDPNLFIPPAEKHKN